MILLSTKHRCMIFGLPLLVRILCLLLSFPAFLKRVVKSSTQNKNQEADWDSQNPTPPCPIVESANFALSSASLLPSGWGKSAILEAGLSRYCVKQDSVDRGTARGKTQEMKENVFLYSNAKTFSILFRYFLLILKNLFR